jgi:hypothetical protein
MNMQTIQIMILLLDSCIKLAPWRIVTETMDRIGYSASESLARRLVVWSGLWLRDRKFIRVMQGPLSLMSKAMQVFMDLDKMIGRDFEAGPANLKTLTEN